MIGEVYISKGIILKMNSKIGLHKLRSDQKLIFIQY